MASFCHTRLYHTGPSPHCTSPTFLYDTALKLKEVVVSFCPLEEAELGSVASQEAKPPSSSALTSSSFCVQVNWAKCFECVFNVEIFNVFFTVNNSSYCSFLSQMLEQMLTMFTMKVRSFPSGHSKVSTVTLRVTLRRGLHTEIVTQHLLP